MMLPIIGQSPAWIIRTELTDSARVHYTIGSSFSLPPKAITDLEESIKHYTIATDLTNSPLLLLDVAYNHAQSLITLADLLDDTDTTRNAQELRVEASRILSQVLDGQEEFLVRQAERGDEAIEEVEVGADNAAAMEVEAGTETMEVDGEGDGEEEETFETYLPTPSTFIDTALALVELSLSAWESIEPLQPPTEEAQSFVRAVLDRAARLCPSDREPDLDLAEIKVLMSVDGIVWDMYRSEAKVGSGVETSLEGATTVMEKLLGSLDPTADNLIRAEILTTLAETHSTIADRLTFLLPQLPAGPSHLAQQAWHHYSQAITQWNKALELPVSSSTAAEFKPSVYLNLSKASLERARLGRANETAKRNAPQLLENAWTYATKAAEFMKWNSLALGGSSISATIGGLPAPGGWDMESLGREVILHSMRLCFVGSNLVDNVSKSKYTAGLEGLVGKVKKLPAERRIQPKDLTDFVEDLNDEGKLDNGEKEWWETMLAQLSTP
jgi:hypothetical protein